MTRKEIEYNQDMEILKKVKADLALQNTVQKVKTTIADKSIDFKAIKAGAEQSRQEQAEKFRNSLKAMTQKTQDEQEKTKQLFKKYNNTIIQQTIQEEQKICSEQEGKDIKQSQQNAEESNAKNQLLKEINNIAEACKADNRI